MMLTKNTRLAGAGSALSVASSKNKTAFHSKVFHSEVFRSTVFAPAMMLGVCLLSSMSASAELPNELPAYAGVSVDFASLDTSLYGDYDFPVLKFRSGKYLHENFAIEAQMGFGLNSDTQSQALYDVSLGRVEAKLSNMFGLYAKGVVPFSPAFTGFLQFGYSDAKADLELDTQQYGRVPSAIDDSGFSYGIGADYLFTKGVSVNAEYLVYLSEDDYDYSGISLGLTMRL